MTYIIIIDEIREELCINIVEYYILAMINSINKSKDFRWKVNRWFLGHKAGISRQSVLTQINKLVALWYLDKTWNIVNNEVSKKLSQNVKYLDAKWQNSLHYNNNNYNNNYNEATKEEKDNLENVNKLSLSLDDLINIWNSVEDKLWKKFKSPKTTNTFQQLFHSYNAKKNVITDEEFYLWLENYLKEISKRKPDNDYFKHRFTLEKFMKQNNWLEKFIYNY